MSRLLLVSGGAIRIGVAWAPLVHLAETQGVEAYSSAIGVSSGALCVQKFAADDLEGLRRMCLDADSRAWFSVQTPLEVFGRGLTRLKPLEKTGKKELRRSDFLIPVGVGVDDLQDGIYRNIWTHRVDTEEEWRSAYLASCAQHLIMHGYNVRIDGVKGPVHRCQDGGGHSLSGRPLIGRSGAWEPDPNVPNYGAIDVVFLSPVFARRTPQKLTRQKVNGGVEALLRYIDNSLDDKALADLAWLQSEADRGIEVNVYSPEGGSGPSMPGKNKRENRRSMRWKLDEVGPDMVKNVRRL